MVHHFGLSCLCAEETFQQQCRRIFNSDEVTWDAMLHLARGNLCRGKHWCDGLFYEAILCPMVDILDSKEACIQMIDGFVRSVDGQAVESSILDLDLGGWTSVLDVYFNPKHYIVDPPEDEDARKTRDVQERKKDFMVEAWEVFWVGVRNHDLGPFRRFLNSNDNWLSAASVVYVVDIGERLTAIFHYLE